MLIQEKLKMEEVEEVVEFDDELEQVLREQQRKQLQALMLQNQ